ncbi:CheR family methyltransferase [Evansella clarkii]|jgi:chemotaxis protein methyltransferase CheR|uniref:CheR family methyltransferase n=1 Tax=Evansella clarkii TaxID=79879 RepID=UPI0009977B20|nr:protein-glutamate O-methyltransferase CheR [Evansella clarkii]
MQDDYQLFVQNIKSSTGIDLGLYKEAQMKRRLTSLREKQGFTNFQLYYKSLIKEPDMMEEFLTRMTINVSEFFRNPERWEILEKKIQELEVSRRKIKMWSAACSTGEEPYTLAMLLRNYFTYNDFEVLATDIDKAVLEIAKKGFYIERSLKEVPREMLDSFFVKSGSGYEVKEEVKKTVKFRQHNLLSDNCETGYDLIICRNVMIYFTEEGKQALYKKLSDSLRPGGLLFVGSTEQIFNPKLYGLESEDTFFYRKASS